MLLNLVGTHSRASGGPPKGNARRINNSYATKSSYRGKHHCEEGSDEAI